MTRSKTEFSPPLPQPVFSYFLSIAIFSTLFPAAFMAYILSHASNTLKVYFPPGFKMLYFFFFPLFLFPDNKSKQLLKLVVIKGSRELTSSVFLEK